ncbi:MAG: hypothetical protein ACOZEN_12310 [Thermodesulfobacteriota bacterium]
MAHLVYSFAVFDTCLVRLHARPIDQLFALAARVLPPPSGREDRHEFVRMRLRAEEDAREGPGLEAAVLGMVYERFPRSNPWGLDPEALYATELDMCLAGARPVPAMLERVRAHVRRGERVVYVTDSILPGPALRRLLESHGFAGEVYGAGELGKRKGTGSLYRHVLAAESVEPGGMLHTGADHLLDVRAPKSAGIDVSPFPEARFTSHEENLLSLHRASDPESSRAVAASRMARLRNEAGPGMERVRAFAASVAAPVLTAFTAWAMRDAGRRGAGRLYFLAREGELPYLLAKALRPVLGGPEPRYLMGSLAAWTAPLAAKTGKADLEWLAAQGQSRRPADILSKISLTAEELLRVCGRRMPSLLSDLPLAQEGLEELWELLDQPEARRLLASKAATARELALEYLRGEGALDSPVLAVADMGWTLFTQRSLRMVLAETGVDVEGWYFGLAGGRLGRLEAGAHHALFMERAGLAAPGSLEAVLFRNAALMERAFTRAAHGRVTGYERRGGRAVPVLGPEPPGADITREIRETCLAYASAMLEGGVGEETLDALMETARESLRRFLVEPDHALAKAVAAMPDQEPAGRPSLRRLTLRDAARAWLAGMGFVLKPRKPPLWVEGSAALARAWLRPYLRRPRLMSLLRAYFQ